MPHDAFNSKLDVGDWVMVPFKVTVDSWIMSVHEDPTCGPRSYHEPPRV